MIHVHVADEDIVDPQEIAGAERRQIAEIEEEGATPMQHFNEQRRVTEAAIHQGGMEVRPHQPSCPQLGLSRSNSLQPSPSGAAQIFPNCSRRTGSDGCEA
jgi:hypothetical protein